MPLGCSPNFWSKTTGVVPSETPQISDTTTHTLNPISYLGQVGHAGQAQALCILPNLFQGLGFSPDHEP